MSGTREKKLAELLILFLEPAKVSHKVREATGASHRSGTGGNGVGWFR